MLTLRPAKDRGTADYGWLKPNYTFSFADYHDPRWMGFRSLRVINEDRINAGMGFDLHPHRNMEIITVVIEGGLKHRDEMNGQVHEATLTPGRVQRMSAGTGVRHSEVNASGTHPVHLLQIWITPNQGGLPPRYDEKEFPPQEHGLTLLCSHTGRDHSLPIYQDADVWLAKLDGEGSLHLPVAGGRGVWVQVFAGHVQVNGTGMSAGDGAAIEGAQAVELLGQGSALVFDLA